MNSLAWLCAGDFNEILSLDEKVGDAVRPAWQMKNFREMLEDCGFSELLIHGPLWTWSRRDGSYLLMERLDRGLANQAWLQRFSASTEEHIVDVTSDHLPFLINVSNIMTERRYGKKLFRFENMWIRDPGCEEIIQEAWNVSNGHGIEDIKRKIAVCAEDLADWNKLKFGNVKLGIEKLRKKLTRAMSRGSNGRNANEIVELQKQLRELQWWESMIWRQRANQLWLAEGDKNSKYFHAMATSRKRHNSIVKLKGEGDEWVVKHEEMESMILNYFISMFSTMSDPEAIEMVLHGLGRRLSAEMETDLLRPFSEDDVREALFQMNPAKSPGPDGMNARFYQKY